MRYETPLSDRESVDEPETDDARRRFLAGSAGALGTVALGGAFGVQPILAHEDDDEDDGPPEAVVYDDTFEDDVAILNYALTLEFLEAAFYERALDEIDDHDLLAVTPADDLDDDVQDDVLDGLETIRDHERTHAETLETVVDDLGGDPVDEPDFEFGEAVEDAETFIATAAVLEDTGVGAYAGAAPAIENDELVPPALSIHSVEAKHASFVRILGGESGFPNAFDDPLSPEEVLERASQFIDD